MDTKFEYPDGLQEHGRRLWDLYCEHYGDSVRELDTVLLAEACKIADLLPILHEKAREGAKSALVNLGIAEDKLLLLSGRLGLSVADRIKAKVELTAQEKEKLKPKEKPKFTRIRKSSLDDFTPEQLGIVPPRTTLEELRAIKPARTDTPGGGATEGK